MTNSIENLNAKIAAQAARIEQLTAENAAYREAESKPVAWRWYAYGDMHITQSLERMKFLSADGANINPLYTSPVLGQTPELDIEAIMNKVQEYASAWASVGGPFDSGGALIDAKNSKAELRKMLLEAK